METQSIEAVALFWGVILGAVVFAIGTGFGWVIGNAGGYTIRTTGKMQICEATRYDDKTLGSRKEGNGDGKQTEGPA